MSRQWNVRPNPTVPVQVEGEDVFLNQLLLHDIIEKRSDLVHRDPGECHAQDAIELGSDEGDAWLLHGLPEDLVLDFQVPELQGGGDRRKINMKKIYPQDQGGEALNTGSTHHHAFALASKADILVPLCLGGDSPL